MSKRDLRSALGSALQPGPEPEPPSTSAPTDEPSTAPATSPPAVTQPAAQETDKAPAPETAASSEPAPAITRRRGRPRSNGERVVLVLWVPVRLRERMRAKSAKGVKYGEQVLDALEAAHHDGALGELVAGRHQEPVQPEGALFARVETPPRSNEVKKQVTVRGLLPSQRDTIFALADEYGVSVSDLVGAALDRWLAERPRAMR